MTIAPNMDSPRTATANPPTHPVPPNLGQAHVVRSSAGGPVAENPQPLTEVAKLIDASYQNVAAVEHGRRNLTIDIMRRLAVAVGCSLVLHLNPDGAPQSARLERGPAKKS